MFSVQPKRIESMITRDGIRLDADLYYPDASGSFPVLLMRQPYGRAIASTVTYAHPQWYAAHGYIVVIQDVRGRGTSAGDFDLFAHEINDGIDTVNWAAALPQSCGTVGMYGFSYQGMTQIFAAAGRPPALKTICPAMIAYDLYADWAYEGDAFCLFGNQAWALQLAAETARRQGNKDAYTALYAAAHQFAILDPIDAACPLLAQYAPDSFYHDWLQRSDPSDLYWRTRSPQTYIDAIDLPMLHIGGWFDTHLRGTLKFYEAMRDRSSHPQQLWIGPWAHIPWSRRAGAVDFGAEAASPIDQVQIRWFDHVLKGIDTGLLDQPPVHLFEMGRNQWRSLDQFPSQTTEMFYFQSNGLASINLNAGAIAPNPDSSSQPDTIVHDPWRPVPAIGGHAIFPAGPSDRAAVDSRSDVITYTSSPLSHDIHVGGTPIVEIYCEADASSFDLCVVLSDVLSTGAVMPISQGYKRIQPTSISSFYQIPLQATCYRFKRGSLFRISISATCFPAYSVNAGTGHPTHASTLLDARIITIQIFRDGDRPSRLILPVLPPALETQFV